MSELAVQTVLALNALSPLAPNLRALDQAKLSVDEYQQWEQAQLAQLIPEFGGYWDLRGKQVLDLGCGLGGKTIYYAQSGARQVVGIDLRTNSLESARLLGEERTGKIGEDQTGTQNSQFCLNDAARMPFADNTFDAIVSINVLEHVDDLYHTLRECQRVLQPGGVMLFHFPPFYSPWGAHLEGWINFPWPHVFFPDSVLLQAAHRVELAKRRNAHYIPTAQVDWGRLDHLPELNRVTAGEFFHLIEAVGLGVAYARMLPFGRHFLARRGAKAQQLLAWLEGVSQLPGLREVMATKMVFVLTKHPGARVAPPEPPHSP
ncbi:MAG: class I SAM-dependent methyltransferase [Litorilinea sp.]